MVVKDYLEASFCGILVDLCVARDPTPTCELLFIRFIKSTLLSDRKAQRYCFSML